MLKAAFNALTRLNSRTAQMKRLGNPDSYTPCRIMAANYFRYLRGPEYTTIHGREFVIPIDSMQGHFAELISFSASPTAGSYKIRYDGNDTAFLTYTDGATVVQAQLRLLTGLSQVIVSGSFASGFKVTFPGFSIAPLALSVVSSTLEDTNTDPVMTLVSNTFSVWDSRIKRGDKIIDNVYGLMTIDEIIEMPDVGGAIMGFRVRCE